MSRLAHTCALRRLHERLWLVGLAPWLFEGAYIRLANPALTETQLFIAYYPWYAALMVYLGVGFWISGRR